MRHACRPHPGAHARHPSASVPPVPAVLGSEESQNALVLVAAQGREQAFVKYSSDTPGTVGLRCKGQGAKPADSGRHAAAQTGPCSAQPAALAWTPAAPVAPHERMSRGHGDDMPLRPPNQHRAEARRTALRKEGARRGKPKVASRGKEGHRMRRVSGEIGVLRWVALDVEQAAAPALPSGNQACTRATRRHRTVQACARCKTCCDPNL